MSKKGPLTFEEKSLINREAGRLTPSEIAEELGRKEYPIRRFMQDNGLMKFYGKASKDKFNDITTTHYWEELSKQFTKEELDTFRYHWTHIVKQFRDDIFHTEELQIIDAVKLEVLANRVLTQQTDIRSKIDSYEKTIQKEKAKTLSDRNMDLIRSHEVQIASFYAAVETLSKEYRELLKEKNNILKSMRATREQRVKEIENSKETMAGWLRQLLKEPQKRYEMGLYMEKMRIATEVEFQRLSELHVYADNSCDNPLLVPENDEKTS